MITFMRNEMDVEMTSGAFALAMIIIYGFQQLFISVYEIKFLYIIEIFCISYLVGWLQKLLFGQEKVYYKKQYNFRKALWFTLPILIGSISTFIFGWYDEFPFYSQYIMIGFIIFYQVIMWLCMHKLYQSDTMQLNGMLHLYQEKNHKKA
jgi:hypothetical protein